MKAEALIGDVVYGRAMPIDIVQFSFVADYEFGLIAEEERRLASAIRDRRMAAVADPSWVLAWW